MRPVSRVLLAVAGCVVAMLPMSAAQSAGGGEWVEAGIPAPFAAASIANRGHLAGHPGNWHSMAIDVDGDDDWVTGGLIDWHCPGGADSEFGENCTRLFEWEMLDEGPEPIRVTWSKGLRHMRVFGPVEMYRNDTGEKVPTMLRLRLHAVGVLTKSVFIETNPDGSQTKYVEADRLDATATAASLGWVSLGPDSVISVGNGPSPGISVNRLLTRG